MNLPNSSTAHGTSGHRRDGTEPTVDPTLRHITFDCTGEPYELARFWSNFLGHPISDTDEPGDDEVLIELPAGTPGLLFIRTGDPKKTKNRLHFDLAPMGRTRSDRTLPNCRGWVVMTDPEGNEFCVERGGAELKLRVERRACPSLREKARSSRGPHPATHPAPGPSCPAAPPSGRPAGHHFAVEGRASRVKRSAIGEADARRALLTPAPEPPT
ncbi:VOC family protein [Streptomyces sp. enrichment culture]|uniref:VOC family protein n=1 Tax=Streptomyces sp. enrichment culture TaxID=1795815 RepID=UPI003F566CF9